jgi:hypothetical protein
MVQILQMDRLLLLLMPLVAPLNRTLLGMEQLQGAAQCADQLLQL